ncbi:hypothetical protein HZS_7257, partial [Henneguya salminicola]
MDILKLRKTKYKLFIKTQKIKTALRNGIEKTIKNPLRILTKLLNDSEIHERYKNFLKGVVDLPLNSSKTMRNTPRSMWTKKEEKLLSSNINKIVKDYGITDISILFAQNSLENKKFKNEINFRPLLTRGFKNRTPNQIYMKAYYMYHKDDTRRRWTEEEIDFLISLHKIHNGNWIKIGEELNRSPFQCSTKFRCISVKEGCKSTATYNFKGNVGEWSQEEETKLRSVISNIMNVAKESFVFNNIPWKRVSEYVETRSAQDCRQRWLYTFCWKGSGNCKQKLTKIEFFKLLPNLNKQEYNRWKDIDWDQLWHDFDGGDFTPSPPALIDVARRFVVRYS